MKCSAIRPDLIEAARAAGPLSPVLERHVETCADCARFYRGQLALTPALLALPAAEAPRSIESAVLAEFDRAQRAPAFNLVWRLGAGAALAAALAAGLAIIPRREAPPQTASQKFAEPFIEIPYVAPLAPYERAEIRHMDVPVAALINAGFELPGRQTGVSVPADVLVGQDGRIHAIRLNHN
jgi:hypothetical protein